MWLPSAIKQQCHRGCVRQALWPLLVPGVWNGGFLDACAFTSGEQSFVLGRQGPFACWGPRCLVLTIKTAVLRCNIKGKKQEKMRQVEQVPRHRLLTLPARVLGCKVQKGVCANNRLDCFSFSCGSAFCSYSRKKKKCLEAKVFFFLGNKTAMCAHGHVSVASGKDCSSC